MAAPGARLRSTLAPAPQFKSGVMHRNTWRNRDRLTVGMPIHQSLVCMGSILHAGPFHSQACGDRLMSAIWLVHCLRALLADDVKVKVESDKPVRTSKAPTGPPLDGTVPPCTWVAHAWCGHMRAGESDHTKDDAQPPKSVQMAHE